MPINPPSAEKTTERVKIEEHCQAMKKSLANKIFAKGKFNRIIPLHIRTSNAL